MADAMAEHSICQPGRPCPHGDSHHGSPGFDFFQRAKSVGEFFSPSPDDKSPVKHKTDRSNGKYN